MLAVDANKPFKTVAELTAAVKPKGDKASYATAAPPSVVMGAMYKAAAGLQAVEVNYKTSQDSYNDLMSGALDYGVYEPIFATAQHRQGKLRVLAVSSSERLAAAPDLPTMIESGVPGMNLNLWWAAMVPAKTPRPIVDQLNAWFNQVTASEDAKKFLNNFASDPWMLPPDQAQAMLEKEFKDWAEYMRLAKLEPQG
jgi:tripartite-type tricarboxylate transporter receptor subunit TctC